VLAEASLLPAFVRVASGRRAVALAVGHLDGAQARGNATNTSARAPPPRKAVIVVLTAGWSVLCFDHNLALLWEKALGGDFPLGWEPREVAALVTSHALQPGDRGLVLVAASAARGEGGDPLEAEEAEEARGAGRSGALGGGAGVDGSHHVNYYAFEGRGGGERWRHESADFHRDAEALSDALTPQHNYRLSAAALAARHLGEVECREFREAVLSATPHVWAHTRDTRLKLAHWAKHRHVPRGAAGGRAAAAAAAAAGRAAPNVVVAHLREGLEAVALDSGRTLCKLLLPPGGLHADLNADGVLDHAAAAGWAGPHGGGAAPRCTAVVSSGTPARGALWNGSVCRALADPARAGAHGRGHVWDGSLPPGGVPILLAPPAALPVHAHARRMDAAFLNSRGDVSSFSPEGRRHFQLRSEAGWAPGGGAAPTLAALRLRAGAATAPVLLAAGERVALLLSPGGALLAQLALPQPPAAPLQPVDLRGDGVAGLLLRAEGGLYAFRQVRCCAPEGAARWLTPVAARAPGPAAALLSGGLADAAASRVAGRKLAAGRGAGGRAQPRGGPRHGRAGRRGGGVQQQPARGGGERAAGGGA